MEEQRSLVGEYKPLRTLADGQKLIGYVVGQDILPPGNPVNFVLFAQLAEHGLGDAMLCRCFCFNDAVVCLGQGNQRSHTVHVTTSQY